MFFIKQKNKIKMKGLNEMQKRGNKDGEMQNG
jgi:hypothetical protein